MLLKQMIILSIYTAVRVLGNTEIVAKYGLKTVAAKGKKHF